MGVIEVSEKGLTLTEINPDYPVDQVIAATEAELHIASNLLSM